MESASRKTQWDFFPKAQVETVLGGLDPLYSVDYKRSVLEGARKRKSTNYY